MVEEVAIPKLGMSDYGTLIEWRVSAGDTVEKGDVVAIIESDKASADVEAPESGTLLETYVEEGEEIEIDIGYPIAVIGEEGESAPSLEKLTEEATSSDTTRTSSSTTTQSQQSETKDGDNNGDIKATPRAKRYAQEHDVVLEKVEGTGPQGAITEDDLKNYVESTTKTEDTQQSLTVKESKELVGTRKTIAERLSQSAREKPHVMGTREIPIEQLRRAQEQLEATYGVELSLNDLIIFFVSKVLTDLPEFNAHFEENEHRLIEEINIGYAVNGPNGLVVPVINDVGNLSVQELSNRRETLVNKVLDNEYTAADLSGGTFTVTNVGVFDMDVSYSIINPPEVAILAVGRRKWAPVERGGEVSFERVITFSLTIDHRVLDGADSGAFLEQLAEYIQYPGSVFESVK